MVLFTELQARLNSIQNNFLCFYPDECEIIDSALCVGIFRCRAQTLLMHPYPEIHLELLLMMLKWAWCVFGVCTGVGQWHMYSGFWLNNTYSVDRPPRGKAFCI